MATITNDSEFRDALSALPVEQQRVVAAMFVESVSDLSDDQRVSQALTAAKDPEIAEDAMNLARRNAKAASLEAHARCGSEGEWTDQAGYFVARAAEACVEASVREDKGPAWKAAMSARMARTCLAADSEEDSHDRESHAQYDILKNYLDARG